MLGTRKFVWYEHFHFSSLCWFFSFHIFCMCQQQTSNLMMMRRRRQLLMLLPLLLHTNCSYLFRMFVHFHMGKWSFKINIHNFESQRQKECNRCVKGVNIFCFILSTPHSFHPLDKETVSFTCRRGSVREREKERRRDKASKREKIEQNIKIYFKYTLYARLTKIIATQSYWRKIINRKLE